MRTKSLKRILLPVLMLLVLALVTAAVNFPPSARRAEKTGSAVGEILPDFTAVCTDGTVFSLAENRGRTVVVNLWATWCGPCVEELPDFDRLAREHPEIAVLALHSDLVTEDVAAWCAPFGFAMPVAVAENGALPELLGGGTVLPRTVIVSPDGVVLYNAPGAADFESLLTAAGLE